MRGVMYFAPHYKTFPLESMEELRRYFPNGEADELNWCFCSTSGVHGMYTTLDTCERHLRGERDPEKDVDEDWVPSVTVLVVQPRLVVLRYGHLDVTLEDVAFLRGLVRSTLAAVATSQEGNT